MNSSNTLVVHCVTGDILIGKKIVSYIEFCKWTSIENLYRLFDTKKPKIKYFDDEQEPISLNNDEDYLFFIKIIMSKRFPNNEVVVVISDASFNWMKCTNLQMFQNLKFQDNSGSGIPKRKNLEKIDYASSSSSSSSERYKSKKHRSMKRYAAELRKELNYLPGSEVSEGQTIIKKWRIKNIGTKKWKADTVKCVLLPSEFSDWVQCGNVKAPICFADQKIDLEMEIKVTGKWTEEQLRIPNCSQIVKLTWLLFIDKITTDDTALFMSYILSALSLTINVKNRMQDSVLPETMETNLKKHTSESSIEKIDQDFSIVNMTDDEDSKQSVNSERSIVESVVIVKDSQSEIEIDLPDLPNGDDFQITDFHHPNNFISGLVEGEERKTPVDIDDSSDPILEKLHIESDIDKLDESNDMMNDSSEKEDLQEILINENENSTSINLETYVNIEDKNGEMTNENDKCHDTLKENEDKENNILDMNEVTKESVDKVSEDVDKELWNENIITENEGRQNNVNEETRVTNENNASSTFTSEKVSEEILENTEDKHTNEANTQKEDDPINTSQTNERNEILPVDSDRRPELSNYRLNRATHEQLNQRPYDNRFPHQIISSSPGGEFRGNINSNTRGAYQAGVPNTGNNYWTPAPVVINAPPFVNFSPHNSPLVPPVPSCPSLNPVPLQNQSSEAIIQNLARNGNIPGNINNKNWYHAPNGDHYQLTINMNKLKEMGFNDMERNRRILIKFQNNLENALHEMIDE